MYEFKQILEFNYVAPISYEEYMEKRHNSFDLAKIKVTLNRKGKSNQQRIKKDMQRYCSERDLEIVEKGVQMSYRNYILYMLVAVCKIKGVSDLWICVLIRGLLYDTTLTYRGKTPRSDAKLRSKINACITIARSPQAYLFVRFDKEYRASFPDDPHYHHELSDKNVDCLSDREVNHKLSYLCFLLYFGNEDLYLHMADVFTMHVYSQGEIVKIAMRFPECNCGDVENCDACRKYVESFLKDNVEGLYIDVRHFIPYYIQQEIYPKDKGDIEQGKVIIKEGTSNSNSMESKLEREVIQKKLLLFCDPFEASEITVSGKVGKQSDYRTIKDRFPSAKITEQRYNGKTQYFTVENKLKYHKKIVE